MASLGTRPKVPTDAELKNPDYWMGQMRLEKQRHHRAMARINRGDFAIKLILVALALYIAALFLWELWCQCL